MATYLYLYPFLLDNPTITDFFEITAIVSAQTGQGLAANTLALAYKNELNAYVVVSSCENGFYDNTANTGACDRCHPACTQCTGALISECQACVDGYWRDTSTCTPCH